MTTIFGTALCKNFQRLGLITKHTVHGRFCSTRVSNVSTKSPNFLCVFGAELRAAAAYQPNLRVTFAQPCVNIDRGLPPRPSSISQINEFPLINRISTIGEPPMVHHTREDSVPDTSLELPMAGTTTEKRAVTAIVIRRRKMKKHKRIKLRKRMRALWSRIRQQREMKKEKAFHAELLAQIKKAESFDPKAYVESRFAKLDEVRWPSKYRGVHLPEAQVREFLLKDQEKRDKRYNKPRLTL